MKPAMTRLLAFSRGGYGFVAAHWAVLGLTLATALPPSASEEGPIICPYRLATGHECPGCGITRAVAYSMHGEWDKAQGFNRAVWVVTPLLIFLALHQLLRSAQRIPAVARNTPRWLRAGPRKPGPPPVTPPATHPCQ